MKIDYSNSGYELIALIKEGDRFSYVINKKPVFLCDIKRPYIHCKCEHSAFLKTYKYNYTKYAKAFGGREFDIKLNDGKIVHASGQWWMDYPEGIDESEILSIGYSTIEDLRECFVFTCGFVTESFLEYLLSKYTGKTYEYNEYERILKGGLNE